MIEQELEQFQQIYTRINELLVTGSFQLGGVLVIFLIGPFATKKIASLATRLCKKYGIDITIPLPQREVRLLTEKNQGISC